MVTKEETRARLESLKKDQDTLKRELAALDTFMEKKARRRPREPEPRREAPPRREYREPPPRYAPPPRREYREPPPRYEAPRYREEDMYDLVSRNLDETRKMMDKFDYLLDTLISSMEEVEGENVDELIKALAQSQMHVMEVLTSIKGTMDKAVETSATKKELDEMERDQASHYQELNKKLNIVMEQMQNPPYLQELDQIKASVGNLQSELTRLQKEGLKVGGVSDEFRESVTTLKTQTDALAERITNVHSSLENISEHVHEVQATTTQLTGLKQQMDKMRDILSAKDDAILNETQLKISKLEEKMTDLNSAITKLSEVEKKLSALPVGELGDLANEIEGIKKALPGTSIKELHTKLDRIEESLASEVKKKALDQEDKEILLRLVNKASELEEELDEIGEQLTSGEAAETYSRLALENKVAALEKLADNAMHYEEVKEVQQQLGGVMDEIKSLRRQVKSIEVLETYSRLRDKAENIDKVQALDAKLAELKDLLDEKARGFEESMHAVETNEAEERKTADMLQALRTEMEKTREEMGEAGKIFEDNVELRKEVEEQRKRIAAIESEFDHKTSTIEREFLDTKEFFDKRRKEREEEIQRQLKGLRSEILKAREAAKEVPPDLDQRISKIYAEMESLKRETPEELKSLASQISQLSNTMDEVQKELRYGEARGEKLDELGKQVDRVYSQVTGLTDEANKSKELFDRLEAMEKALETAKELQGRELETAIGSIKNELSTLEGEVTEVKEGEEQLNADVKGVHGAINALEKKTRDEIYARLHDLKQEVATTDDIEEVRKALASLEKRLKKEEEMESVHDRVVLAKRAAEKGSIEEVRSLVKEMPVPRHVVIRKIHPTELGDLLKQLKLADNDYNEFIGKVEKIREEYEKKGQSKELDQELMYLEEDLLDFWIDKRGLAEALAQAKQGNVEEAKQLLEYERGVLEDLKLDINSLRMKAGSLPKEVVTKVESAIERREHAEEELTGIDALKESVARMKKERQRLKKELEAVKGKSTKAVVPERVQASLDLAKDRPTPAVGKAVVELEQDLKEKKIVPVSEVNLEKAREKLGELAGKAKQIEFGTGDKRATVSREKLEKARTKLGNITDSSESLKQMILIEELNRIDERISLDELATRTGLPIEEIKRILATIVGNYAISGGFVTKP